MLTSVKEILMAAKKGGYAVGAFNTTNLETTRAIVDAAKELRSPVVIQVTEKTMEYAGGRGIFHLVKNDAEFYAPEIPVGIHLDHGKSLELVERAVEIGFTSVMYDGSRKKLVDNMEITKKVVDFCHSRGVDVQAELGNVPYLGELGTSGLNWDEYMTDPEQAETFVKNTNIDALAVAIGNAHNFFKERETPDFDRLEKINRLCNIPLVLHGASDWDDGRVQEAIARGITCFNVDTATRVAFTNNLIQAACNKGEVSFDVRALLGGARDAVCEVVKKKMALFGSKGRV